MADIHCWPQVIFLVLTHLWGPFNTVFQLSTLELFPTPATGLLPHRGSSKCFTRSSRLQPGNHSLSACEAGQWGKEGTAPIAGEHQTVQPKQQDSEPTMTLLCACPLVPAESWGGGEGCSERDTHSPMGISCCIASMGSRASAGDTSNSSASQEAS